MRHLKPTKIFVSAARPNNSAAQNATAHNELGCDLALIDGVESFRDVVGGYTYTDAEGTRRHTTEASFLVFIRPGCIIETLEAVRDTARNYRQDSILVVHGDDAAEVVECNTECSAILGTFQALPAGHEPNIGEDYTLADETFYVVR